MMEGAAKSDQSEDFARRITEGAKRLLTIRPYTREDIANDPWVVFKRRQLADLNIDIDVATVKAIIQSYFEDPPAPYLAPGRPR